MLSILVMVHFGLVRIISVAHSWTTVEEEEVVVVVVVVVIV